MQQKLRAAEQHLAAVDPVMAQLIERHGPCGLLARRSDPFHTLCGAIISQQLSTRAADTIQSRVMAGLGAARHIQPPQLLAASHEQLCGYGLSNAKAKWLRALATAAHEGHLDFIALRRLDDESAIALLDALPGIGRWTAEMFLMFALGRLDLFALDDVGLQRGLRLLYGRPRDARGALPPRRVQAIIRPWAPYRSVASWYLWRAVEATPVSA
ncbi:DNA-3-methyladenine glycosylase II [Solimonas aquatica]|uniref:DNA-3-methyladenine glycosylase II n=1 Tax=Solimonas aquatica TaxID=489703 RepID=A0A1H9CQR7_9GAMM|nr:DNA-3-methyladenine glycosylase 2 family protein [Solimonas aquatica]SEQ03407.1 DNA-3-methyladenine glycosylase II [Solimonas aquatica]